MFALTCDLPADSIWSGSTGSLYAIPPTASFTAIMTAYTGGPVNPMNTQVPFWNNPSEDGLYDGHYANAGNVLAGVATNGNLIGMNLIGTTGTLAGDLATQINGTYYAYIGGSDPVNATMPTTAAGITAETTTPLAFSFLSNATAYNIAVLFADSSQDTGLAPSATVFGYYARSLNGSFTLTPLDDAVANDPTGTLITLATNDTLEPNGYVYGFYATVCYQVTGTICTESVTYTTGAGNYSTNMSAGNQYLGDLGYNHFALFELASGAEVLAFKDYPWALGSANNKEGVGDFNDVMIELTPNNVGVPEPCTIDIIGLGLAALGLAYLGRRGTR
jgi:hypothetical protein